MNKKILAVATVVIAIGVAGGWWYAQSVAPHKHQLTRMTDETGKVYYTCPMHPQVKQGGPGNCPICGMKLTKREEKATGESSPKAEREVLYWYDPMKPDQHFDKPGKSPFMNMQLVPKYAAGDGKGTSDSTLVEIDPRMAQNLGMRTSPVTIGTFSQRVDAVGSVMVDERRIVSVEARAPGWVERLDVRSVGDTVTRGQVLAGLYSPDLLAAQEELVLAQKLGDKTLVDAARTRLSLLGVNGTGGAQRRVAITAPQAGVVTELMVRQGAQVTPGMPLMKLADLSKVWVQVEVPEAQASWVVEGQPAEARLKALPGRVFEGTVDYLYPLLDAQTRTLRARLVFDNADGALKPGMYADATLFGDAKSDVTLVPSEAVIRTGTRSVVLVAEDVGRYRPVEVTLGPERSNEIVVTKGLQAGQQVVVSGQFLIDSEASLLGAYQRMGADAAKKDRTPGTQSMESTDMPDMPGMKGMGDMNGMPGMRNENEMDGMEKSK
jgi:Cu(I)/Ag(I) efflux system membrane fusion protein